jgi:hypothetical protein
MKGKQPLWLICDVSACLRLHLALAILGMAVRRFLPRNATRPPGPEGVAWISIWQAACEALLRWVIARQAFRLCGLDPGRARIQPMSEARTSLAWYARNAAFIRMYESMTACARRLARRIAGSVEESSGPNLSNPDPANFQTPDFRPPDHLPAAPAGQRIRAPPWLIAAPQTLRPRLAGPPARPRAFLLCG